MILQEIINSIESVAPLSYQEAWDNSGLQVGERSAEVKAALLAVDVTESIVNEAITRHCDLIVSHHPLLFRGLKHLTGSTPQERCVEQAIRHGIAIYSAHTSMDSYIHGVSGRMAERIGISEYRILSLQQGREEVGLGVIGNLPTPMQWADFVRLVHNAFLTEHSGIRCIAPLKTEVQTIALCGGAGAEFMETAIAQGADVYISADFKYHEMQSAVGRIGIIDLDHWVSEQFTRDIFRELLTPYIRVGVAATDHSPVMYFANDSIPR